jgi:hypothetical protein
LEYSCAESGSVSWEQEKKVRGEERGWFLSWLQKIGAWRGNEWCMRVCESIMGWRG